MYFRALTYFINGSFVGVSGIAAFFVDPDIATLAIR